MSKKKTNDLTKAELEKLFDKLMQKQFKKLEYFLKHDLPKQLSKESKKITANKIR